MPQWVGSIVPVSALFYCSYIFSTKHQFIAFFTFMYGIGIIIDEYYEYKNEQKEKKWS